MPLTFPSSPTNGQTYVVGSRTWTWNGSIWEFNNSAIGVSSVGESEIINGSVTQAKLASNLSGITVCTSSTRPGSPFEGQMIYETNTDKTLVWNGSAWYADWNTAWGKVAYASSTTAQASVSTVQDITGMSVTFTAVAGRHYRLTLFLPQIYGTVAGDRARIDITDASNNSVQIGYMNVTVFGSIVSISCLVTASGSVTYKGRMRRDVGTGTIDSYADSFTTRYLLVEDIGPA